MIDVKQQDIQEKFEHKKKTITFASCYNSKKNSNNNIEREISNYKSIIRCFEITKKKKNLLSLYTITYCV